MNSFDYEEQLLREALTEGVENNEPEPQTGEPDGESTEIQGVAADDDKLSKRTSRKKRKQSKEAGFKKAPQAPKRFKSPYILFSIARMEQFKKEMDPKTKVTSISRLVADEWKKLSPEERKRWDLAAKRDKDRYNAEKSIYTGPWQVPSKRSRKDPSAPKRPMSAFLLYSQGMRQKLKAKHPEMKNTEISRLLGGMWKASSEDVRRPHVEREKREREQYNKDIAEWRKRRDDEDKAMREQRQMIAQQKQQFIQPAAQPQNALALSWIPANTFLQSLHHGHVQHQQHQQLASISVQSQPTMEIQPNPVQVATSFLPNNSGQVQQFQVQNLPIPETQQHQHQQLACVQEQDTLAIQPPHAFAPDPILAMVPEALTDSLVDIGRPTPEVPKGMETTPLPPSLDFDQLVPLGVAAAPFYEQAASATHHALPRLFS